MNDSSATDEQLKAVIADRGALIDLVINGVVVGRIEWNAEAASHAIFGAIQYEDALREAIISQLRGEATGNPPADPDRGATTAEAVMGLAVNIGMQLRMVGQLASNLAANAPVVARQLFKDCRGCGTRFIPLKAEKRRRHDARYCTKKCQRLNQKRTRTKADHAKQQQERRDNALAKRVHLDNAATLREYLRDRKKAAKHGDRLRREDPYGAFEEWMALLCRRDVLPS